MSTLAFAVNVTLSPDAEDSRAIRFIVASENKRREAAGEPLLPVGTRPEAKQSYETCLSDLVHTAHLSFIKQSVEAVDTDVNFKELRSFWSDATPQQQAAALAALGG
jgi:hypothetical protein